MSQKRKNHIILWVDTDPNILNDATYLRDNGYHVMPFSETNECIQHIVTLNQNHKKNIVGVITSMMRRGGRKEKGLMDGLQMLNYIKSNLLKNKYIMCYCIVSNSVNKMEAKKHNIDIVIKSSDYNNARKQVQFQLIAKIKSEQDFLDEIANEILMDEINSKVTTEEDFLQMLHKRTANTNCPNIHLPRKQFEVQDYKYISINHNNIINIVNDEKIDEKNDETKDKQNNVKKIHIVHISDTHMRHKTLSNNNLIPFKKDAVNILIHSGDFSQRVKLTKRGEIPAQIQNFKTWFASQPHHKKIVIAGNHEMAFNYFQKNEIKQKIFNDTNVTYLQDESTNLYGIKIYGTPWTSSNRMGFSAKKKQLNQFWKLIPNDIDILVSHLPPMGVMDTAHHSKYSFTEVCKLCNYLHPQFGHWGGPNLLNHIINRIKPKVHLFGHVHQCNGFEIHNNILFINSAMDLRPIAHEFDIIFDL